MLVKDQKNDMNFCNTCHVNAMDLTDVRIGREMRCRAYAIQAGPEGTLRSRRQTLLRSNRSATCASRLAFGVDLRAVAPLPRCRSRRARRRPNPPPPVDSASSSVRRAISISPRSYGQTPRRSRGSRSRICTRERRSTPASTQKRHKQTWMDRLAGTQPDDQVEVDEPPLPTDSHLRSGGGFEGQDLCGGPSRGRGVHLRPEEQGPRGIDRLMAGRRAST